MKKIVFLFLIFSVKAYGLEIEGKWVSSLNDTIEYNDKFAVLTENQASFSKQTFGKITLEFSDSKLSIINPDSTVKLDGKEHLLEGYSEKRDYTILGKDSDTIVIKSVSSNGDSEIVAYQFESIDKMWIYIPSTNHDFNHLNIREYFVRVK